MLEEGLVLRQSEAPTAREMAIILFRQRRTFLWVAGVILVLAVLYAGFGASYRAHMAVLVRRGRADPPVTAQPNAPPDFSRVEVTEEELNSEVELLKGDDVLRAVAQANNLGAHDWMRWLHPHEGQKAQVERAARKLAHRINVEPVKKTDLIAISYDAADPKVAAAVLQSLATAYLEKHMEVHRPGGELRFFDQQTTEAAHQLDEAKAHLADFMDHHGVVMAGQQRDMMLQRLDDVDSRYREAEQEAAETSRRAQELEDQLAKLPARSTTQMRTADNPELLRSLKASLLDLQLKRVQLLTKYEPTHRLVQEVDKQIAETQAAIAGEKVAPLRDETTDQDQNYEWAKAELQKAQVELKGLQARLTTMNADRTAYRAAARQLGDDAIVQDDLTSQEKAAEDNYLLYARKREEARMGDALDQGGIVNVAIAEQPTAPALPVWPPVAVACIGFVAAVVSGTGVAFAADHLDPALRTPDEARLCLNIPVLASLPERVERRLSA